MVGKITNKKNGGKQKGGKRKYIKKGYISTKKVKAIAKQVVNNKLETYDQNWNWVLQPFVLQSGTSTMINNYFILNPSNATANGYDIVRGTGSGQMTGNKISLKSAYLKYVITSNVYHATTNLVPQPYIARIYFFKSKRYPMNDPQTNLYCGSGPSANFFDIGTSDIGFFGNVADLTETVNRDAYIYLGSKTFKIGQAIPAIQSVNNSTPNYPYSNNDFKMCVYGKWNVTKYLPKTMNRDDGSGTWQNPYVIGLIQIVAASGYNIAATQQPLTFNLSLDLTYTDA